MTYIEYWRHTLGKSLPVFGVEAFRPFEYCSLTAYDICVVETSAHTLPELDRRYHLRIWELRY